MSKRLRPRDKKEELELKLIDEVDRGLSWTFIILISILPLLVRVKVAEFIAPLIVAGSLNTGLQADCFAYYKWIFLICIAVIAVILLLYKMLAYQYEIQVSYINIPVLLLLFFILLSLITAEHKSIALFGLYNQCDGTLTYLCYLVLLIAAANTSFKAGFEKYITIALGIFISINVVIILFDFFGHNLAGYPAILSLIFPPELQQNVYGTLNSTLNNPNYVSGLAAALFTYFLTWVILETKLKQVILYILLSVASFTLMLASLSTSGFVSLLITSPIIIAIAFLSRGKKQTLIMAGVTLLLCIVIFFGMNAHNPRVYNETLGVIKQALQSNLKVSEAVAVEYNNSQAENQSIKTANNIETQPDCFKLPAPGRSGGSGRFYIWGETSKLIRERPLTGYGMDTLAYYFPQNDIKKIAGIGSYNILITKAHNMYLGMAYGAGIPALLTLLALFLLHFYYTGKRLLKGDNNDEVILPAALFAFFCTFIVQWLANDSVIGSSAIFWVLLGIGVSLNSKRDNRITIIKN